MKKHIWILCILAGMYSSVFGQTHSYTTPTRYWIQFRDKKNTPYTTSNPLAYLSPRSIQRRLNQLIPINESDIPVNQSYVDSVAATGAHVHVRSKWFNGVVVQVSSQAQLDSIRKLSFVISSVNVATLRPFTGGGESERTKDLLPAGKAFVSGGSPSTSQSMNYGPSLNQINMLHGVCLHDIGYQGQGMVIAVLDAGFQHADTLTVFDSLRVNHQIIGTHDFVAEDDSVYGINRHFHGTCVLSCMGGNMPGQLIGTAPKAQFWLLITEDVSSEHVIEEYNWAAGAEFADSVGADVINTSLGYTTFDDSTENHTYADMNGHRTPCARAANYASNKGIAVVCAAGNMGGSGWHYIGTPADADSVLAVGSVNANGVYSSFSSEGPGAAGQIKPAVASEGEGSIVADWASNGILVQNGTSFASPIMCGLVACLWQAHPELTNMEVLHAIEKSASQFSHPDSMLGYGIPDFCSANQSLGVQERIPLGKDFISSVYPVPFSDSFEFLFWSASTQEASMALYDGTGRLVRLESRQVGEGSYTSWKVNGLSTLSSGLYFTVIKTDKETIVRKLVK